MLVVQFSKYRKEYIGNIDFYNAIRSSGYRDILLFRLDIKLKDHGYSSPYNLKCK